MGNSYTPHCAHLSRPCRPRQRLDPSARQCSTEAAAATTGSAALSAKRPTRIAVGTAGQLIAARCNGDVLVSVHLIDHRRRLGAKAGLELPQQLTSLSVIGLDVAVGLAVEDEATGGGRRTAAVADTVRRLRLPHDLVGVAANRSKRAAHW